MKANRWASQGKPHREVTWTMPAPYFQLLREADLHFRIRFLREAQRAARGETAHRGGENCEGEPVNSEPVSSQSGQAARSAAGKAPTETGGIETKTGTGIATGRGPAGNPCAGQRHGSTCTCARGDALALETSDPAPEGDSSRQGQEEKKDAGEPVSFRGGVRWVCVICVLILSV